MKTADVLIVGGGPAGSSLAWGLRRSGLDVHVMDKKTFPRDKVCAGWITPAVVSELQLDLHDYEKNHTLQPLHGFKISQLGSRAVKAYYPGEPVSYGIRRCEFDHYLLERSEATLHLGVPFKTMVRHGGYWIVNDAFRAPLVVGAGGHFCPVARQLGAKLGHDEQIVAAQEIEFSMTFEQQLECSVEPAAPELFFCRDLKGYGWIFRKGDYVNIGLGREDNHRLSEHIESFVRALKSQGKIPQNTPEKFHGHAYLLYPHAKRKVVGDGVLLIGDAAGLAYPQSGEGIRPAVESGLLAAEVVRAAAGAYESPRLKAYEEALTARFGARQAEKSPTDPLPGWIKQPLAKTLLSTHWFVRHMVMDRWFLHIQQPPLKMGETGA